MSRLAPHRSFAVVACLALAAVLPLLGAGADDDAPAGRKYALLVGVKNYDKDQLHSLQYTESDVNDLAAVLKDAGYKRVVVMTQSQAASQGDNTLLPTAKNVRKKLAAILDGRKPDDSVLIAFSGHGVQYRDDKASYFCPMDADLEDLKTLVSLADVYQGLENSAAGTKVLLADCCRNDPQAGASKAVEKVKLESVTRPQAEQPPRGIAALFSCSAGEKSYESEKLGHGIFFHYVIEGLRGEAANKKGEVTLQSLASYVADEVPDAAKDVSDAARQRPQQVGDLSGAVTLVRDHSIITNSLGMKLKLILPPGKTGRFQMGGDVSLPQHEVELSRPFYVGQYPVTQAEYVNVTGKANPSWFSKNGGGKTKVLGMDTSRFPVEEVSWDDAVAFCEALNRQDADRRPGWAYALPTEAEWEYACRAGTTTIYFFGDDSTVIGGYAWYWVNSESRTHEVGSKKPNPWGLHDMNGNVWQWCADRYGPYKAETVKDPAGPDAGSLRVLRGGAWFGPPADCTPTHRFVIEDPNSPYRYKGLAGFRVVLRSAPMTP